MAKKGYYSPEAIQGRQRKEVERYTAQQEKKTPAAPAMEGVPPPNVKTLVPSTKLTSIENIPTAVPYLAYAVDKHDLGYYGTGFQGFIRKAWADLSDPKKYMQDINDLDFEQQAEVKEGFEERQSAWTKIIEEKVKWSQWGEKIFGLKAEEVAAFPAALSTEREIAQEAGKSDVGTLAARAVRLGVDTVQTMAWGGLAILGVDDEFMRKAHATVMGVDAVADKFSEDTAGNFFEQIHQLGRLSIAKDVFTIAKAVSQNKITWSEAGETIKSYQKGSAMAYTMIFDNAMRAEFEKGVLEGKDPGLLAQDYGRVGIELAGSILGSPSTYLGMAILKPANLFTKAGRSGADVIKIGKTVIPLPWQTLGRTATFGELIGANIGKARLAKAGERFVNSFPELENALKVADKASSEAEAINILDNAAKVVADKFTDMRTHRKYMNLAALDSDGKVKSISRDADYFFKALNNNYGTHGTMLILRDMQIAQRGGTAAVEAAKRLLSKTNMAFSDVGRTVAHVLGRLDEEKIVDLVLTSKNHVQNHAALYNKLEGVLSDIIPSVDEMLKAESDIAAAVKAGIKVTSKQQELADMAKDLPSVVRVVNIATRIPEKVVKGTTKAMVRAFMNLVPRAWARNVYGQAILMGTQIGFTRALGTSLQALAVGPTLPGVGKKVADVFAEQTASLLVKRLGMVPIQASLGVGDALQVTKTKYGFLPAMQRSEQATAGKIVLHAASDEILKALPAVVNNLPEYQKLINKLPPDQQALFFNALKRNHGVLDDALDTFRSWAGKGEIEAWRVAEPSENMRRQLEYLNVLDDFYNVQATAKSPDDFKNFIDEAVRTYEKIVTENAQKLPSTANRIPDDLQDFMSDVINEGKNKQFSATMTELIQGWELALEAIDSATQKTLATARSIINKMPNETRQGIFDTSEIIQKEISTISKLPAREFETTRLLRDGVVAMRDQLKNVTKGDLVNMWKGKIYLPNKKTFSLADIYPDEGLSKLTPDVFRNRMWSAYFEDVASRYRQANIKVYTGVQTQLENLATSLGTTLENIAMSDKGGDNPFLLVDKMVKEAGEIEARMGVQRFFRSVQYDKIPDDALLKDVVGDFSKRFPDWQGNKQHIVNSLNKGLTNKVPYEEITLKQALAEIAKVKRVPPHDDSISEARVLYEGLQAFKDDIMKWSEGVISEWGNKVPTTQVDTTAELRDLRVAYEARMKDVRTMAGAVGVETRDFVLHDYNKTYMDHALSYLLGNSMHYWTTRTYKKSMEVLADNPKFANMYLSYKEYMQKKHADMPDWYKQNVQITGLPGIDPGSTYFLNLEAMINPIYGMTGVDFNDPRKRVDWVSRMVDDANKLGPTFSPLISWAVAIHLYNKSEEDAAQRWFGRILPQTQLIKSATATITGKAVELDPFAKYMGGGVDPYERNRVIAAMALMVQNGDITQEQMIEASRAQEGDIWQAAVAQSAQKRFLGDVSSFFLGAGLRPRTEDDMRIEKFWGDYSALISSKSLMTPDQYREAWGKMRDNPEYGAFVDGLLLSRKTGDEQDSAYAYNVFSRVPPGQLNDIATLVGITPAMVEAFYNAKGDFTEMDLSPQDKERFLAGTSDIGVMYSMPDGATRQQWEEARSVYRQMQELLKQEYNDDIVERISDFYDIDDEGKREVFLEENPDVKEAMERQTAFIAGTPVLTQYYGGIYKVEQYYTNQMHRDLEAKYGADIRDIEDEYYAQLTTEDRKLFKSQHPELDRYQDDKKAYQAEMFKKLVNIGKYLPESPTPSMQAGAEPYGEKQEALYGAANPEQRNIQYWQSELGSPMIELIQDYWYNDTKLPNPVKSNLDYVADKYGYYDGDEMLQAILMTLP